MSSVGFCTASVSVCLHGSQHVVTWFAHADWRQIPYLTAWRVVFDIVVLCAALYFFNVLFIGCKICICLSCSSIPYMSHLHAASLTDMCTSVHMCCYLFGTVLLSEYSCFGTSWTSLLHLCSGVCRSFLDATTVVFASKVVFWCAPVFPCTAFIDSSMCCMPCLCELLRSLHLTGWNFILFPHAAHGIYFWVLQVCRTIISTSPMIGLRQNMIKRISILRPRFPTPDLRIQL